MYDICMYDICIYVCDCEMNIRLNIKMLINITVQFPYHTKYIERRCLISFPLNFNRLSTQTRFWKQLAVGYDC